MKTTLTEQEGNSVRLDVEVPADEVQSRFQATLRQLAKEVKIPGFRKGKVPSTLVEQRFGRHAIVHQMLDDHLSDWYGAAVEESGIAPVDRPEIDYDEEPETGKPFAFRAMVTVLPVPQLGAHMGVEVPRIPSEVEDAEVDARVDRLRDEFAELEVVSDRAVQEGDFVSIDAQGYLEGEPVEDTKIDDYMFQVGGEMLLPDLEQGVVGMASGEAKTIALVFPEDYGAEDLAGKTLDFAVTVKEIKRKVLPALNDEFAKDVSEFETLLELRLDIRKKLQSAKEAATERAFRAAALEKAVATMTVDVPSVMIERQAADMVNDFARSLTRQRGDFQTYLEAAGTTPEQMMDDLRPQAELTVKTGLLLDAVVEAEGLELSDEELDKRIAQLAAVGRVEPAQMRSRLEESGRIDDIRQQLLREKAADLIVEHAVPVAPPEKVDESVEGDEAAAGESEVDEREASDVEV